MKKVSLGFSIVALSAVFLLSCKKEVDVAPVPDTEVESSIYASFANYVASDIEMACSFMGENAYNTTFYSAYSASSGTVGIVRDTNGINLTVGTSSVPVKHDQLTYTWNETRCKDGRIRKGTIFMYVPIVPNQRYCRQRLFQGRISFDDFKVDGWRVTLFDSLAPAYLYNTLASNDYDPTKTKLTWRFAGKLKFTHPTNANLNMVWEGELFKTLENTSDPKVFEPKKQTAITWSLGVVSYYGNVSGKVPQIDADGNITPNVDYKMEIKDGAKLVRDFLCSPDKVTGVTVSPTGSVTPIGDEHHPFKTGVASFTVGNNYPRQIYYGNEGDPKLDLQCDNTGEVLIKGNSYKVTFFK
ncbi:hypothetical protein [Aurantibacillus circumpalustris]|uniref:hypothetical protein n=1 Tax=Aurantibacillus circumpalustris TaxID=3036359 RepID=UPI00295B25D3|nr:hypothetical protein [Aurantibacillus circumpalustris]